MTWSWMPAGDRPPPERLEQPRADEGVGDERVDDGHDRRADEAQEDGVDPQRGVRRDADRSGWERRAGEQRDGVRDRVERRQAGDDLEEEGRHDGQPDQRSAPNRSSRSSGVASGIRVAPTKRLAVRIDGGRMGASRRRQGARPRRRLPRWSRLATSTRMRFRSVTAASGRGSTVRSALSRAMTTESGAPAASADSRDVIDATRKREARARLAVDRGRHEARRRERRRGERHRVREEVGDVRPELLVEHPDDDPDRRVELEGGQRRIEVGQVVIAGQDDDRGGLDRRPRAGRVSGVGRRQPAGRRPRPDALRRRPFGPIPTTTSSRARSSSIVRTPRWSRPHTTA